MAIVMRMTWRGVTPQQYDEVRRICGWVLTPPTGGDAHIASFDADGVLHCTDVWQDRASADAFFGERVLPAVMQAGITTEPEVTYETCHELFVPHVGTITIPDQDRLLAATPV
jgi:hypothetical protein